MSDKVVSQTCHRCELFHLSLLTSTGPSTSGADDFYRGPVTARGTRGSPLVCWRDRARKDEMGAGGFAWLRTQCSTQCAHGVPPIRLKLAFSRGFYRPGGRKSSVPPIKPFVSVLPIVKKIASNSTDDFVKLSHLYSWK